VSTNVSIEVDKRTAEVLESRAAELGVTVPQLIAELAALDGAPREAGSEKIAELDRRYAETPEGSRVPHDRVVQWLRTWGTPRFRPWPGQQPLSGRSTPSSTSIDLPRSSTTTSPTWLPVLPKS
jgi:predicted transcriptional regulator